MAGIYNKSQLYNNEIRHRKSSLVMVQIENNYNKIHK